MDGKRGVLAVLVFGSACRGEDFVAGLSDVDLLVILGHGPEARVEEGHFEGFKVSTIYIAMEEFERLSHLGISLAHWVKKDSKTIYCSAPTVSGWLRALQPKITRHT